MAGAKWQELIAFVETDKNKKYALTFKPPKIVPRTTKLKN